MLRTSTSSTERVASSAVDGWLDRTPLSAEELERGRRALIDLERFRAELLAERGGRLFEPAWQAVEEARSAWSGERE